MLIAGTGEAAELTGWPRVAMFEAGSYDPQLAIAAVVFQREDAGSSEDRATQAECYPSREILELVTEQVRAWISAERVLIIGYCMDSTPPTTSLWLEATS